MLKANYYSKTNDTPTSVALPAQFSGEVNSSLLTQAIHIYRHRSHRGTKKTKTRAEVSITKKKIYKQKGTGGARHGARSAPIFVGGGVTHGPTGARSVLTLPQAMRKNALKSALVQKAGEGLVCVSEELSSITKSSQAQKIVKKVSKDKKPNKFTFVIDKPNEVVQRAIRNLQNSQVLLYSQLNAFNVYFGGMLILDSSLVNNRLRGKKK